MAKRSAATQICKPSRRLRLRHATHSHGCGRQVFNLTYVYALRLKGRDFAGLLQQVAKSDSGLLR